MNSYWLLFSLCLAAVIGFGSTRATAAGPAQLTWLGQGQVYSETTPRFRVVVQYGDVKPRQPRLTYRIVDVEGRVVDQGEMPFQSPAPEIGGFADLAPEVPPGWYEAQFQLWDGERQLPLVQGQRADGAPAIAFARLIPPAEPPAAAPAPSVALATGPFPPPVIPQGVGVNIHFTGAPQLDLDGLAALGVRWVRMDLFWSQVERQKGHYDFSAYDALVDGLAARGIAPLFILDYGNDLYQEGAPRTPEARAAFVRFAVAAAQRYRARRVIWELWNEPNLDQFWRPRADVQQYLELALEAAQAIKAAVPDAVVIAPGVAGIDLGFIEEGLKAGLLPYLDGISFHPYRSSSPETAAAEYARLRALLARYAPDRPTVPLISSEWGYTAAEISPQLQAQYLVRMWLSNLEQGIPLSIWYDWRNDGLDPREREHHFGTVYHDYTPKPAFVAGATLTRVLGGYQFVKRILLAENPATPGTGEDYLLLFTRGDRFRLAAWTTAAPHAVRLPVNGSVPLTRWLGEQTRLTGTDAGLALPLGPSPVYLELPAGDEALQLAAAWTAAPAYGAYSEANPTLKVHFTNPFARPLTVRFRATLHAAGDPAPTPAGSNALITRAITVAPGQTVLEELSIPAARADVDAEVYLDLQAATDEAARWQPQPYGQRVRLVTAYPLTLTAGPDREGHGYWVQVGNPTGKAFVGTVTVEVGGHRVTQAVRLAEGEREAMLQLPSPEEATAAPVTFRLETETGQIVASTANQRYVPYRLIPLALRAVVDGDRSVPSRVQLTTTPEGDGGRTEVRVDYTFAGGWSFWRLTDELARPLPGQPKGLLVWVYGDGQGHWLRMRFVDATGQTLQPTFGRVDWTGWKLVYFPFSGQHGHWGGANDGQVHWPIRLDSLVLLDAYNGRSGSGTLRVAGPMLVYAGAEG